MDKARETLVERLRHAFTTASNDDVSKPGTRERERHCQRLAAIEEAASELTRLKAELEEVKRSHRAVRDDAMRLDNELCAAEAQVADLSARLARAVEVMRRVNPALSAAFQGGMEEREGGSANRQARYMESVDQLRADARAFLSEQENRHGNG